MIGLKWRKLMKKLKNKRHSWLIMSKVSKMENMFKTKQENVGRKMTEIVESQQEIYERRVKNIHFK